MLPLKFESPEYAAVTECEPGAREDVEKVAWPEPLIETVDNVVEPSLKVTVPVGVPAPGAAGVTVAVNVSALFRMEGFAEELTFVTVGLTLIV